MKCDQVRGRDGQHSDRYHSDVRDSRTFGSPGRIDAVRFWGPRAGSAAMASLTVCCQSRLRTVFRSLMVPTNDWNVVVQQPSCTLVGVDSDGDCRCGLVLVPLPNRIQCEKSDRD